MKPTKHIAESLILHIWEGQHLRKDMMTTDGRSVEVNHSGSWNPDTGPDFKDAEIKIDGDLKKGDLEIHLRVSDWNTHGHHMDPRYNRVILHAAMWSETRRFKTVKENGERVPILILSDFLDEPIDKLLSKISKQRHSQKCPRCAEIGQADPRFVMRIVDAAAEKRLEQRIQRFEKRLKGSCWDQTLYEGIMEALGYSKNKGPFLKLAKILTLKDINDEIRGEPEEIAARKAQAMLFGVAGLLPSQSRRPVRTDRCEIHTPIELDQETMEYIRELESCWKRIGPELRARKMESDQWQFFRLRPANFPTRRLAGMSFLLPGFAQQGILETLLGTLKDMNGETFVQRIEGTLVGQVDEYWSRHYRFGGRIKASSESSLAIGHSRVKEIVVNAIFPVLFLYARKGRHAELERHLSETYTSYGKLPDNEITRFMVREVFGKNREKSSMINSAKRQQGLIHIYKEFCKGLRCSECVFRVGL